MSVTIDQNRVKVAIDWINKLANGMNPIDGSILPDSDIVNNVHPAACSMCPACLKVLARRSLPSKSSMIWSSNLPRRLRQRSLSRKELGLPCSSRRSTR